MAKQATTITVKYRPRQAHLKVVEGGGGEKRGFVMDGIGIVHPIVARHHV